MSTRNKPSDSDAVLDEDILEVLAEAQDPAPLRPEFTARLRTQVLSRIEKEKVNHDFLTIRQHEGVWCEIAPKMAKKVLFTDPVAGIQSYLLRLDPGFEHQDHDHPIDEECLMLEGELTLGSITLKAGDYHLAPKRLAHGYARSETGALLFIRGAIV